MFLPNCDVENVPSRIRKAQSRFGKRYQEEFRDKSASIYNTSGNSMTSITVHSLISKSFLLKIEKEQEG